MQKPFKPAKKGWVLAALGLCVVLPLAFALLLRADLRAVRRLDAAAYDVAVPQGFRYASEAQATGGALQVSGWACIEGERLLLIDNWVVLYSAETGYLRLPTTYEVEETPTALINDGIVYGRAGYVALAPLKKLAPGSYELCFAYRNNENNLLVHTGQSIEVPAYAA